MKKIVLRLITTVICLCSFVVIFFLYEGHSLAYSAMDKTPISMKVEEYESDENYVSYDEIDEDFVHAVIAVEDKRFFTRNGFDWIALVRAILNNTMQGKNVEGGSTISQQIAKNLYFVGQSRGIGEKIAEVYIMLELEEEYTKEELFTLYANMNYYGDGYWGIEEASNGYYGVSASDLTIAQSAMLAGIPNAPSAYQLSSGYNLAKERQLKVLKRMLAEEYITEEEYNEALLEDVHASNEISFKAQESTILDSYILIL